MKTLYLIRHASASIDSPTKKDIDRPLNSTGIEEAEVMAKFLNKIKTPINLIVTSPAARAKSTAYIFAKYFFYPLPNVVTDKRIFSNNPDETYDFLFSCNNDIDKIILVGHNPVITLIANELGNQQISSMKPAGIVCLEFPTENWDEIKEAGVYKFYMDPSLL